MCWARGGGVLVGVGIIVVCVRMLAMTEGFYSFIFLHISVLTCSF